MKKGSPFSSKKIRSPFFTGLVALLPTMITIFIIVLAFNFMNNNIAHPIGFMVLTFLEIISGKNLSEWKADPWAITLIGFPLAIIIIFILGYIMATLIGRNLLKWLENWFLKKFPLVNAIYPYAKQFTDILFTEDKKAAFKMVVAIQYPRLGIYTLGFVTSDGLKSLNDVTGHENVCIFIPSSPTPFTGYTIFVPRKDIIPMKLSVDAAIRTLVSGGILIPPEEVVKLKQ